ncbi:MAG TPA: folylpolyglutamate synthase/dihydrofolate synthase family protein [Flavobacteriaceae bacterium]|nr:folylpolyglutamate synthase/dihydrofolate synthase family protein [Flavobacteriaceae bacterium]
MNYPETLEWMFQQLPMYQRQGKIAFKKDLSNTLLFAEKLGNPERKFKSIHVGGTNGKGSVSHMLASIFQEAGYKTGLYTSPHLKDFRERIKINGKEVSKKFVVDFIGKQKTFLEQHQLSFFEMTVGMAFDYFATEKVDIAIIEVGMGGRLDSTNIISPEISVITNIGLDHTQFLGESLVEIAKEKAGIIKQKTPVVIGEIHPETTPIFQDTALKKEAPIHFSKTGVFQEYPSDLKGKYQQKNKQTVLQTIEVAQSLGWKISEDHIFNGMNKVVENTKLRGRWDVLQGNPKVVCDTAHNQDGLKYVLQQLLEENFEKLHIVLGVVNDKDLSRILPLFPKNATYYFCKPNIPRGMEATVLKENASAYGLKGNLYGSVKKAYLEALANATKNDLIFVGGSTFTVAEII